ncbi:MAG: hypothetical protein JOZ18_15400 [Chloroflexi bacterium]|nr:hypothetical protein [Chloroflexota bacterium]
MEKANKDEQQNPPQAYDASLKDLVEKQAADILPILLPGAAYEETLNVEVIRPPMRVDRVYKVRYRNKVYILHLEFESGSDNLMTSRLLAYNSLLYLYYQLPVISIIIYPFRTTVATSPFCVKDDVEEFITFRFRTLRLFEEDARKYVDDHVICMYALLPTMQNVDHVLLKQAMNELVEFYREDEVALSQQFVWMEIFLNRTDTVSDREKSKILEELNMYDRLWEENPRVQQIRAESKLEASQVTAQQLVVDIIEARFPSLIDLAQQRVRRMTSVEDLRRLAKQIATAPDEATARWVLSTYAA